jgi:hypothetical protein
MDGRDPHQEPENSTVDDWHGQKVERLMEDADDALKAAKGDPEKASARFDAEHADRNDAAG